MRISLLLICSLFLLSKTGFSLPYETTSKPTNSVEQSLTRQALEKQLGRKLSLKERLGFWLVKKKWMRTQEEPVEMDAFAIIGFVMTSLGSGLLILGIMGFLTNLFVTPFVMIGLGMVSAIVSLSRITKSPTKKRGKNWAALALIIGILWILLFGIAIISFITSY